MIIYIGLFLGGVKKSMWKEISIGLGITALILTGLNGYDVFPLIMTGILAASLYFFVNNKGVGKKFVVVGEGVKEKLISFEDIGGQEAAKRELKEALDFVLETEKIKKLGIRPLKGVLLTGPPGTGKTLLAKAAANFTNSVFLAASGSEFIEMYAGVGAQRVRDLFKQARLLAKKQSKDGAIIFIDEIDVLGSARGQNHGHMEYEQTLNQLLVEMDGLGNQTEQETQVLVVGATNRSDILDPALMRPGRFDRIVAVDLPDKNGRKAILSIHIQDKPLASDVDLDAIAKETFSFSGAHLESLVNEAAILAMREDKEEIAMKHFKEAVDKVIMGERMERKPVKEEMKRIAIHEMGHALLAEYCRENAVSTITITSRGKALGYVRQQPEDDIYLYTEDYLEQQICISLAGSCAEKLILGNRSTGSSGDFNQAVKMSKQIVASGMSGLGIISIDDLPEEILHQEIAKILKTQEEKVDQILTECQVILQELVELVLEKETLTGEEIREILRRENFYPEKSA